MAINDSAVTEVKAIMRQLKLTPAFLSGMLLGTPSQSMIYDWIRGDRPMPFDKAQAVLSLCKNQLETDKLHVPFHFYGSNQKTISIWRAILLKAGHPVLVRKADEPVIVALLARTPSSPALDSTGLSGSQPVAEPVAVKA